MISNCGHDENNRYSGGKAGDQTGTEWRVINWYNRPWKCVLRHPDAKLSVEGGAMALIKSVKTVKGTKSNGEIQHNDEPEQDDEEVQG